MDSSPPIIAPTYSLSLAADRYNCYAGELVTLFLRFAVPQVPGTVLQLSMPRVMEVESYQLPEGISSSALSLTEVNRDYILIIPLKGPFKIGETYEIQVCVRVKTFQLDQYLLNEAALYDSGTTQLAYEAVQTAVINRGRYLQNLPEIYDGDNFINRFLMLIESFWKPVSQQIDQGYCYYDPLLTSMPFLPWLASWMGLPIEMALPQDRMRSLIRSAMMFYQRRGTFQALKTYLETYTGGEVTVIERRARDLVLGEGGRLGVEVALGKGNQSNSLEIDIRVPVGELEQVHFSEEMYRRKVNEIVRSLVPAHTVYHVQCDFVSNNNAA
jgi:phage tail-like protein